MKVQSTKSFESKGSSRLRRVVTPIAASALGLSLFAGFVGTGVSSASSLPANVVAAQAAIAKLSSQPTKLPSLPVITKKIPKGKLVVDITCGDVGSCAAEPAITKQATDHLGWKLRVITTDGSASATANAWTTAVRLKPFGIVYQAASKSEFASQLAQAKKEHIHVVTCCTTDPTGADGISYNINNALQSGKEGPIYAEWMVANSTDGNPHALYVNLPIFPILTNTYETLQGAFATDSPNGQLYTFNEPVSDLGSSQGLTDIVNYLTAHPDITEVVDATDGQFIGLPAALSAAGLTSKVKVFGEGPTSINGAYIKAGTQAGSIAFDYYEDMFGEIDALARAAAGVKVQSSFAPPLWVLNSSNLPAAALTGTGIFPVVKNSPALFYKLWK
jgi:ABC-type sugar transport system substrate-binding protein